VTETGYLFTNMKSPGNSLTGTSRLRQSLYSVIQNKAVLYFIVIIAFFISLELTVRYHEDSVFALQEKALIKLQMFLLRGQTDITFIGSSRTQDGIEPDVISKTLADSDPSLQNIRVFNSGSASASLDKLYFLAIKALDKANLKIMAIEVSQPQLADLKWAPSFYSEQPATDTEDFLQKALSKYSYIVRYRKSFRLGNLLRSPVLMMADYSDGTEIFRRGNAKQWLADSHIDLTEDDKQHWQSKLFIPSTIKPPATSEKYINTYLSIAEKAREKGIKLILYTPPVTEGEMKKECDQQYQDTYKELASIIQAPLILHSCQKLRKVFFYNNDHSHLNKIGRTVWSKTLAEDFLKPLLTEQETSRAF